MHRFLKIVLRLVAIPIVFGVCSLLLQRFIYNPIGNPEAKWQMQHIPDSGFIFIGPSVFHQRIDSERLAQAFNRKVHLVTSIGQSTLETLVLTELAAQQTAPETELVIAGHDRPILGTGFHQCWHCSNLPLPMMYSEWQEIRSCLLFDIFLGLLAAGIPSKLPLPFAEDLESMLIDAEWEESFNRYQSKQEMVMQRMCQNLQMRNPIQRPHLYRFLCDQRSMTLLLPLNGRFQSCPVDFECNCIETGDSAWINSKLWIDGGHLSPQGAMEFSTLLESVLDVK